MNKKSQFIGTLLGIFCLFLPPLSSQTPSASFATWKDNKKAAYTIIHDDFSNYVTGIYQYADPIATERGIKLCFGAITSSCGPAEWTKARTMIAHGHECVNHSHNHKCGGSVGQCSGLTRYGMAQFALELDTSTKQIQRNTGVRPRFFIHPYDASTTTITNYLKNKLGYLGARSGTQSVGNKSNFTNFMNLNYYVYDGTAAALTSLNSAVNSAIAAGGYTIREFHGIADGSWNAMTVGNYTDHLDFVKTKMDAGLLWSATATEAITYKIQRDAFQPVANYDVAAGTITVLFTTLKIIDPTVLSTPVTLNVNVNSLTGTFTATQNGLIVPMVRNGDVLSVNIYPHQGPVVFNGSVVPPPPPPACVADGKVVHQLWTNLTLNTWDISALKTDLRYPNTPTSVDTITNLSRSDLGDKYGEKIFGYLVPKTTGVYTFWVTGDDDAEVYLSLTGDSANKTKICGFTGYADVAEYTKYAGQKSAFITLTAGKYYYIEALHVGTLGATNHFHVYWTLPGTTTQTPIDGSVLSSKNCDVINNPPTLLLQSSEYFAFNGRLLGGKIALSWAAKYIDEKDYIMLEKADETTGEFKQLSVFNANKSKQSLSYFSYSDDKLIDGDNVYRLKTVGQNGQIQVSDIVKVRYETPQLYVVFPNPATDFVNIDLSQATQGKDVDIAVLSLLGKIVYQIELGGKNNHQINLENLENGQYFIRIQAQGKKMVMKKLMVFR
jgi:peptidoglycan/xylan/chitin deacetylase (PgdA/CDA1 family)